MSYQVLARKWRPQTFAQMVGQEHVTTTLANALGSGRVAHAYLFTGPRGCGKTTMARLLAKALNCDLGPTPQPCGECASCKAIAAGTFLDVLEIDAASNTGVDNVRELRENAQYQPTQGKKRIFIIDEVHMLSKGAFNALLKTLEEPPPHCYFIFATTEPVRIPRTILSRCQRFDFRLFRLEELVAHLGEITRAESYSITPQALELLASLAEGSMRDALSLLDQAISSVGGTLDEAAVLSLYGLVGHDRYLAFNEALLAHDARKALDLVDELAAAGHDLVEFARGLVGDFRDLLLLRLDPALAARIEKPEAVRAALAAQAARCSVQDLLHLAQRAADNYARLEHAPQPRWLLEAQVVEYAQLESQVLLSEILGRLEGIGGAPTLGGGAASTGVSTPPGTPSPASGAVSRAAAARVVSASQSLVASSAAGAREAPALEPGSLAALFGQLVERVHAQKPAIGSCLLAAAPRLCDDVLQLVFPPEHGFQRETVSQRRALALLTELARECFGRTLRVEVVTQVPERDEEQLRQDVQRRVAPTKQQELERRARENPDLGRLLEGLGGQVIDEG
jgi:DNA polymerase-3 subunit gamma/tau